MRQAEKEEIEQLIQRANLVALTNRASSLRNGIPCSVPPLSYDSTTRSSVMGGNNYHIEHTFADGVVWNARIRRFNATSPPPLVRDNIFRSEVATLRFLERTNVPAPVVYAFAWENDPDNLVGVTYMLQEKMPGRSYYKNRASSKQKMAFLRDLADIYIELTSYPFNAMGSPVLQPESTIGPFAQESLIDFDPASSTMKTVGPFTSLREYYTAEIKLILDLILRGEMYSQSAVDAYLIHLFLLESLPIVTDPVDSTTSETPAFFLTHPDAKGDHILVDDDCHITAMLDWEWTYTMPPALAFNSPIMLFHVGEFYKGINSISEDEEAFAEILETKGRPDLAEYVKQGRIYHRFTFCCGYDLGDWDGFLGLFRGLRELSGIDAGLEWDEWRKVASERHCDNEGLQRVLSREQSDPQAMAGKRAHGVKTKRG